MAEKIYIRGAVGALEPLTEQPFDTEAMLQELIGQHPELLAGDQMRPDDPLRWILIKREMPIEGWESGLLLVDHEARPTLVEVKRGGNREVSRAIVGQMLDYAATAASVWSGDEMREAFDDDARRRGSDPVGELAKLLRLGNETNTEDTEGFAIQFWEQAVTNLSDNRLRLLFVADEISIDLERVVKFLNEQTRDALEILAVEIKQYPGQFGQVMASRLIGQDAPDLLLEKSPNRCLCGCGGDTNKRFVPGHDAKLNATLGRVKDGRILESDIDLGYVAERCRNNPDLFDYNRTGRFYNKYSCKEIIQLAKKQSDHRRQN